MESSCRDHPNYVADHRSVLKNKQNTYNPHFIFTSKTGMLELPSTGVLSLL